MQLLTQALRDQLPPLYSQEHEQDPLVVVKFFCPWNRWTWYATEFDGDDIFFGLVVGDEIELGYFLLSDLEKPIGPARLQMERDLHFKPIPLSIVRQETTRKPVITYIATANEYGKWFEFKVLASNARNSEPAGRYEDFEQGKQAIEQKYGKVSWVSPYRFMKEVTAC